MFNGAGFVVFPIIVLATWGGIDRMTMRWTLGHALESGERVEIIKGTLKGGHGIIQYHGQGGPTSLCVKVDSLPDDVLLYISWRDLQRVS